jgi:hypothetical protein
MTIDERVSTLLEDHSYLEPDDVAMTLIDEDVSKGEYEGCSTELELAFCEYMAAAERLRR